jgi:hypothetical protein
VLNNLSRSAHTRCNDRQPVEHAFENHHADTFVTARHAEKVGRPVPPIHIIGREPAGELNLLTLARLIVCKPLGRFLIARERRWNAC